MSEHESHDPWASLAETLGAQPASEPTPPRPAAAPRPAAKPRTESKPRAAAPATGDWDSLASELGLGGGAAEPPRPAPRPTAPPRAAHDVRDREPPPQRPRVEPIRDDHDRDAHDFDASAVTPAAAGEDRGEPRAEGERRDDDGGERRGRRRRGRRGGRGRSRRDDDRLPRADDRGALPDREPRGRSRDEDRPRDEGGAAPSRREPDDAFSARNEHAADLFAPAEEGDRGLAEEPRSGDREPQRDDEDRPRRRRRRGRRGGRSRGRTESREPVADDRGDAPARRSEDAHDDEPLPSGYGVRPAPRPADGAPKADGEGAEGERRGRRRRRRGGEGRSGSGREAGGEAKSAGRSGQGRRSRRSGSEEPRGSSSTLSRGRRADFKPVSDGFDEDDEGLDFLGIEEAGREAPRRESRPEDDEILAESGLDNVRDVPSWVEAIGIVIAGNLDARSRPRGDDSRRSDGGRR